jgi:hypothetical protein
MDSTSIIAYSGLAVSIVTAIVGAVNHRRIRSNCCGKEVSASLDIESTTPTKTITPSAPTL